MCECASEWLGVMLDSYSWADLSFLTASCLLVGALLHRKRTTRRREHESVAVQQLQRLDAHSALLGFIELSDARNFPLQSNCSPFVRNIGSHSAWNFNLCGSFSEAVGCLRSSHGASDGSGGVSVVVVRGTVLYCSSRTHSLH